MADSALGESGPAAAGIENVHGRQTRRATIVKNLEIWLPAVFLCLLVVTAFLFPLLGTLPDPTRSNPLEANLPLLTPGHLLGPIRSASTCSPALSTGRVYPCRSGSERPSSG